MTTKKKIIKMLYEIIDEAINDPTISISDLVKEALKKADEYRKGVVSYDVRTDKIITWNEENNQFTPGFEEYQIVLFTAEPNWRANESWEFKNVLGKEPPEDTNEWEWADEEAKRQGYENFDDALTEYFTEDIELQIPDEIVLQSCVNIILKDSELLLSVTQRYIKVIEEDLKTLKKRIEIFEKEKAKWEEIEK